MQAAANIKSPPVTTLLWALLWTATAVGLYTWAVRSPHWTFVILIGYAQYIMLQMIHETIHQVVIKKLKGWSFLVGILHYFPLGVGRDYAYLHMAHHGSFGSPEKDPDHQTYSVYPRSRWDFFRILATHLAGWTAAQQIWGWEKAPSTHRKNFPYDRYFVLLAQALLLTLAWKAGNLWAYFVFWILPLVTIVKALGYLRITAEHGSATGPAALRSFREYPFTSAILGPFGFTQHAEHHARPEIPYQELVAIAVTDNKIEFVQGSHFHYWAKTLKQLPWISK